MAIVKGSFPDLLDKTIQGVFYDPEFRKNYPELHKDVFNIEKSDSNYEKRSQMSGLQNMPIKTEGDSMFYDTPAQGYDRTLTPLTYAMGVRMSREMYEDIQSGDKGRLKSFIQMTKALRQSAWATEETNAANILNRAFSGSYLYADGKKLCATDHPVPKTGGSYSNTLGTPADLSYSSLTSLIQTFEDMVNLAGQPVVCLPATLYVPTDLHVQAVEIVKSKLKADTANNNINAISDIWQIEVKVNPFLTDADAWFLLAKKAQHQLVKIERVPLQFENEGDFDTWDMKWGARMRHIFDAWDSRGVAGSEGAA